MTGWNQGVDDLESVLNPLQAHDLETILGLTPERKRVPVALAFVGWGNREWAQAAGIHEPTLSRWLARQNRLPLGGAIRLARVIGIDPFILFQGYV